MGNLFDRLIVDERLDRARKARQTQSKFDYLKKEFDRTAVGMRLHGVPTTDGLSLSDDEVFADERLKPSQWRLDPEDRCLTHGVPTETLYDMEPRSLGFCRVSEDVETDSNDVLELLEHDAPLGIEPSPPWLLNTADGEQETDDLEPEAYEDDVEDDVVLVD